MRYIDHILILTACTVWSSCQQTVKSKDQPNVILIVADDLGWGDVGFHGQLRIITPNIDSLAARGMVFSHMYAGSTVCGPSRASMITGLHTGHGAVRGNPRWSLSGHPVDFDSERQTMGKLMKSAGYKTGMIGKWGLAENMGKTTPNHQGFDYFYGFNKHLPAHHYYPEQIWENDSLLRLTQNDTKNKTGDHVQSLFTNKALNFIEASQQSPYFLYLAYTTPHFELTLPAEHKVKYDSLGWPMRRMKRGHYYHDTNGHVTYASMISKMDDDIGRIIELLKQRGELENTVIIFTSDNGHEYDELTNEFFNSNGPFRGRKRDLYEGGIRVPFIVHWPAMVAHGSSTEHITAFWDIMPTLADITDAPMEAATDGISFYPTLSGLGKQKRHDYLYWEFNEGEGPIQAVVKGNWKLIHWVENNNYELYNLRKDPGETEEVSKNNPGVLVDLIKIVSAARTESDEFPLTRRPNPWK